MRIKKTFTFRLGPSNKTPPLNDEHDAETTVAEQTFKPSVDLYQQKLVKFILSVMAGILCVGISLLLPEFLMKWVAIPGIGFIVLSLLIFFTLPTLKCPACSGETDNGFDTFCPACGSNHLRVSRLLGTHCDACNRTMGSYKYSNYPIRYCTHCGVLVNRKGV